MKFGMIADIAQKVVMTPQLRQAIKILELPSIELADYLTAETLANPLLELESEDCYDAVSLDELSDESPDWFEAFSDRSDLGYSRKGQSDADPHPQRAEPADTPKPYDSLINQLILTPGLDDRMAYLVRYLIWSLDTNGYLTADLDELTRASGADKTEFESALAVLQSLDPPGIGARNLAECLTLQAKKRFGDDLILAGLIAFHLEDLAQGKFMKIASSLGCSEDELKGAVKRLRALEPHPGLCSELSSFDGVRYVVPDVTVRRLGRSWLCIWNDNASPRLRVSSSYDYVLKGEVNVESERYVRQKHSDALRLVRCIEQRRLTILKATEAIVKRQEDFMLGGQRFLLPMTLRDVADDIEVHESTVSRAVNGKYVETPRGVFELRFFFTSGVSTDAGQQTSSVSVKKRIKELVDAEEHTSPLSDSQLEAALRSEGIQISRRTVAKYRDEMGLPPSAFRRMYSNSK